MCGIVGAVAQRDVEQILIEGLRRLEYRGYDSAGVSIFTGEKIERSRTLGKVQILADSLADRPLPGGTGIAHTRWATHGEPSEINAHPHMVREEMSVVHNGIIENYEELREELRDEYYTFPSQTDTEVIVNLVHKNYLQDKNLLDSVRKAKARLEGAYAFGVVCKNEPDHIVAARLGSPLVIGIGIGENFIASDVNALLPVTQKFIFLEDGDVADIHKDEIKIWDAENNPVEREVRISSLSAAATEKGEFRHFMQKEIHEQPTSITNTLEGRISNHKVYENIFGPGADEKFAKAERVRIIACGTSYHAGCVAKYWFESIAKLPCEVEIASEYRYRPHVVSPNTLFVTISQSGETADTLAALNLAKETGYLATLCVCNVPESSLVRESDYVLMTHAGPEIGVASTKAFTTQLTALLLLVTSMAKNHGLTESEEEKIVASLCHLPHVLNDVLKLDEPIRELSEMFVDKHHSLFLGRGTMHPVAMEGALKLKEISYIHAEAYPAGELKHGPLALVDEDMPVITVAPNDELLEKLKSNLQEVKARGGQLIVFADHGTGFNEDEQTTVMVVPAVSEYVAPIVYTLPLQMLSYHVAVLKGTDVDQPRNLAKSVTVE
ncbi:MAG: glutamine--fructose-6-phosphate transaminase (isomerizing) [Gammaproteobacteria bacterium]|nr:MAG: glutamine--fructose-6-phosphate transaminase (isomerizing) [Gammaproteobacteria bacterium]